MSRLAKTQRCYPNRKQESACSRLPRRGGIPGKRGKNPRRKKMIQGNAFVSESHEKRAFQTCVVNSVKQNEEEAEMSAGYVSVGTFQF